MPRWDSASKNKQRLLIQQQKPWQKSTGPRSEYGRQISSRNAKKHRRRQSEPPAPTPMTSNVAFVSQPNQQTDIDRPLEIGDRVIYTGGFTPTMIDCGNAPMLVAGWCQLRTAAIACRTAGGKLIWIYERDLERCPDGQRKHD